MASTGRVMNFGGAVHWDSAGTTTWVAIPSIQDSGPPDTETNFGDATCLEDTREQMTPGIKKATELTFTCFWKQGATIYEQLKAVQDARTEANWKLTHPFSTPKTEICKGYVKKITRPKAAHKDYLRCEVTIMTTEEPTIA